MSPIDRIDGILQELSRAPEVEVRGGAVQFTVSLLAHLRGELMITYDCSRVRSHARRSVTCNRTRKTRSRGSKIDRYKT